MPLLYPEIMADYCLAPGYFNVNEKLHPELPQAGLNLRYPDRKYLLSIRINIISTKVLQKSVIQNDILKSYICKQRQHPDCL